MNQRTLLSTLFIAGMFAAPAAFAQDATTAEQQTPPATEQSSAAEASTMQGDAGPGPARTGLRCRRRRSVRSCVAVRIQGDAQLSRIRAPGVKSLLFSRGHGGRG